MKEPVRIYFALFDAIVRKAGCRASIVRARELIIEE
jgi:hypothetical protein